MKTSVLQRGRNRSLRSKMNKIIKDYKDSSDRAGAEKQLSAVLGVIDKAAQKNVIHKNKAARDKSKMMSFFNQLSA